MNLFSDENLPAIAGGRPVREKPLSYARQCIDEEDISAVVEALRSDWLTTGPKITEFEEKFAAYVGSKYAVAVANGTAALHAAVFAAGIGPGDEVVTTPMTFVASANCVLYCGGTPVFADIDPRTYNINPDEIEKKITSHTRAVIPVHFTGQPCDLDRVNEIARKNNLIVIEDAAHALGAEYKGKKIGGLSDMTIFSFHPVKHITTGEGGMVTTNSVEFYHRLKQFRDHGVTRDRSFIAEDYGPWYYEQQGLGYNYRLTDIQAALGISQLKKLSSFLERRREVVEIYNQQFFQIKELILPYQAPYCRSAWHLYVISLDLRRLKAGRRKIFEALRAENIAVNVHYIPVYHHPFYRFNGFNNINCSCPFAEKLYESIISLPLYPAMSDRDVLDVIKAVHKVINYYSYH